MSDVIVECRKVTRVYGEEGSVQVHALRGVDLEIRGGEFVSMAGPSGSGKSTLLNVIGGLDRPTAGEVIVGGERLTEMSKSELAELRLHKIGFVFQAYNLIPVLSARENVEFIMQLQGVGARERRQRSLDMLEEVGLGDLADRRPADMSGGQQQRVAVARAIVSRPVLLLADEPSANLDSETTRDLLELLQQLNTHYGTTILTATHDPNVMEFAARHIRLHDGAIASDDGKVQAARESA